MRAESNSKYNIESEEMAQVLRALVLAEDSDLIPRTHMATHNHLYLAPGDLMLSSDF